MSLEDYPPNPLHRRKDGERSVSPLAGCRLHLGLITKMTPGCDFGHLERISIATPLWLYFGTVPRVPGFV